jgi:DNA topoisomerase-3
VGGAGLPSEAGGDAEAEQPLHGIERGQEVRAARVDAKQGHTKPPPRFTEGTLLAAMEDPSRFLKDKSLKETIKEGGLGTPATRADIIEKLISSYYVERSGRELVPTARGLELLEVVPPQLRSADLTALWEQRLSRIATGQEGRGEFSREIRRNTEALVHTIKTSGVEYKEHEPKTPCPFCGRALIEVTQRGRKKKICQALSCGYQEEQQRHGEPRRASKQERAMNRRLIRQYSDDSKDTVSFGDLIKAAQEKKKTD